MNTKSRILVESFRKKYSYRSWKMENLFSASIFSTYAVELFLIPCCAPCTALMDMLKNAFTVHKCSLMTHKQRLYLLRALLVEVIRVLRKGTVPQNTQMFTLQSHVEGGD